MCGNKKTLTVQFTGPQRLHPVQFNIMYMALFVQGKKHHFKHFYNLSPKLSSVLFIYYDRNSEIATS